MPTILINNHLIFLITFIREYAIDGHGFDEHGLFESLNGSPVAGTFFFSLFGS